MSFILTIFYLISILCRFLAPRLSCKSIPLTYALEWRQEVTVVLLR